ncbi:MAG: hypothetical protein RIQ47_327 [Bacteroidota bacterium]
MPLLAIVISFSSCEIINPAEPIPGYIQVDSIIFETNYVVQGSSKFNFTDAWVYVDNDYLGTFEMPFTIPVLKEGSHKISIRAGIIENGVSSTRSAYSKLVTYDTTVVLSPNETTSIQPRVTYFSSVIFVGMEDFDDGGISLVSTSPDNAQLQLTTQGDTNVFEGASGKVIMDSNKPNFEVASDLGFILPTTANPYIELNFKGDAEFTLGVIVNTSGGIFQNPLVNVRPTDSWKKIFVNIRDLNGGIPSALAYKIFIRSSLPTAYSSATLYFDNLKVVY